LTAPNAFAVASLAYGLPGTGIEFPREVRSADWEDGLHAVSFAGLTGLLTAAVQDSAILLDDDHQTKLAEINVDAQRAALRLEQRLLEVSHVLGQRAIEHRVLKGAATAHLDYPAPELRLFSDIDLLIHSRDLDRAVAALESCGGERRFAEPRAGFAARFSKAVCVVSDDGVEIDLHRSLAEGPFGLAMAPEELFESSESFVLGGRTFHTLGADERLIHACCHAVLGRPQPELRPQRDVAQLAQSEAVDPDRVERLAHRWRCGVVVARAILLSWRTLALPVEDPWHRWAVAYQPDRFERRALNYYGDAPQQSYARQAVGGTLAVRGLGDKIRYAFALAFPQRSYVRSRDRSYGRRVARGVRLWLRSALGTHSKRS
jgi:Uncharacterised nucleotidyltransferase